MFSIYKKELQSFFYTPFAYVITALFMFLFTYMFNSALGDLERPILQFTFPDIFYNVIFFFIRRNLKRNVQCVSLSLIVEP